jgi:predicted phage terminase large subunit-like protein
MSERGAITKRDWWRNWSTPEPPSCDYLVQSWDTAFSEKESACASACTTWGVFNRRVAGETGSRFEGGVMLLDRWLGRVEFPELKKKARDLYDQWKPEALIVERKASGLPLVQELNRTGLYVQEMPVTRAKDKVACCHAISDVFSTGLVWAPLGRAWADEVREAMASFPNGTNDDLCDSSVWALLYLRQGNFVKLGSDWEDEESVERRPVSYY